MAELEIVYKKIDILEKYKNNARTHSNEQIQQIANSIDEFGFTNPILVNGGKTLIAGHGRLEAAKLLNLEKVPTITLTGLSKTQIKALILADNQLALNAGWDLDILKGELQELKLEDFDINLLGFDDGFLDGLLECDPIDGLTDEDDVPEPPENPVTVLGDIWQLGNHRLMCGDSTSIDAVDKLMDGQKADMVFTDPPYGMSYGGGRSIAEGSTDGTIKNFGMIKGDDLKGDDLLQMVSDSIGNACSLAKDGAAAYVCFTWRTYSEFYAALAAISLEPKACIVWDKKSIGLGMSNYRPQHEFIFYCSGQWYGDKGESDVWAMKRATSYVHPTQKPVELIERALSNSSKSGDVVHDCFGGSGSTLLACEKNNRTNCSMELDPKYCDVIIKRWQDFTGKEATHIESGKTYNELDNTKEVA